jgi:hypothetical protein
VLGFHLKQWPVARAAGRDHHVVYRCWQVLEERPQGSRVVGVEGCGVWRAEFERRLVEPVGISARKRDVSTLSAGASSCLEPDASAAADHDDGLSGQFRFPLGVSRRALADHDRSDLVASATEARCPRKIPLGRIIDTSRFLSRPPSGYAMKMPLGRLGREPKTSSAPLEGEKR